VLSGVSLNKPQSVLLLTAGALLLALAQASSAQADLRYEHVLTIGSDGGLNPPPRLSGPASRVAFGKPERLTPLVTPDSVTVDPDERLWIADPGARGVHVFDLLNGQYKFLRGGDDKRRFQCPAGIDADSVGRVYVSDPCSRSVFVFDRDLSFMRLLVDGRKNPVIERPGALLVSHDLKSIFIADPPRHKIVVFNQEGETVREFGGAGELDSPAALAFWEDAIYVFDPRRSQVQVYSPKGTLQKSLKWDAVRWPSAFAIDAESGYFYVASKADQFVRVFDANGTPVSMFGQGGPAPDQWRSIGSLHVDAGRRVYVVDSDGGKVLLFRESQLNVPSAVRNGQEVRKR
jgi:DNA-binding beta-propeller fold protein YncE